MNKKTAAIVAAVVAVLAIAGIAIAIGLNNQKSQESNQTENSNQESNTSSTNEFNPKDLSKLSYVATSTTTVSGQTVTSTIESDGKGVQKSSTVVSGMTTESYITGTDVITCINGECSKTAIDESTPGAEDAAKNAAQYKDSATFVNEETINGKTYKVWKASGDAGEVTYYIDSENRIGRIVMAASNTTIIYDYKDVSITVPQV